MRPGPQHLQLGTPACSSNSLRPHCRVIAEEQEMVDLCQADGAGSVPIPGERRASHAAFVRQCLSCYQCMHSCVPHPNLHVLAHIHTPASFYAQHACSTQTSIARAQDRPCAYMNAVTKAPCTMHRRAGPKRAAPPPDGACPHVCPLAGASGQHPGQQHQWEPWHQQLCWRRGGQYWACSSGPARGPF